MESKDRGSSKDYIVTDARPFLTNLSIQQRLEVCNNER